MNSTLIEQLENLHDAEVFFLAWSLSNLEAGFERQKERHVQR